MNTHASRMALCACMIFTLSLTACGPKPVEPYSKQKAAGSGTFYDPDSGAAEDAAAAPSYGVDGSGNYSALDNLPSAPGGSAADIYNSPEAAPAVDALSAGSGASEKAPGFTDSKSADYKRKNGRSSPEMKSIYYDFDQSNVRSDQTAKMEANAHYMKKHQQAKVIIEGNCDERGTSEYNLALGERRAAGAKKYLINLGIEASRIRTVSFGEERPLFVGSEESDYEMNRRSDFVLE